MDIDKPTGKCDTCGNDTFTSMITGKRLFTCNCEFYKGKNKKYDKAKTRKPLEEVKDEPNNLGEFMQ